MKRINSHRRLALQHRGVTSIEYALIASLIAIAIVFGVTAVRDALEIGWSRDGWVGDVLDALMGL
ncbi:Flp family type IVb pilin [Polaromonas sp. P1-6]|nr:Flp family type IVb pilin [Polaromonas sp. P1-6]